MLAVTFNANAVNFVSKILHLRHSCWILFFVCLWRVNFISPSRSYRRAIRIQTNRKIYDLYLVSMLAIDNIFGTHLGVYHHFICAQTQNSEFVWNISDVIDETHFVTTTIRQFALSSRRNNLFSKVISHAIQFHSQKWQSNIICAHAISWYR